MQVNSFKYSAFYSLLMQLSQKEEVVFKLGDYLSLFTKEYNITLFATTDVRKSDIFWRKSDIFLVKMARLEKQKHGSFFLKPSSSFPRQTVHITCLLMLLPSMCFSQATEGTTFCFNTREGECEVECEDEYVCMR